MGLLKNEHGVYVVRKKVPERLQRVVAGVTSSGKPKQTFLQRSLRTKSLQQAKVTAKPILIEFDTILARAEALTEAAPMRAELAPAEVERIADYDGAAGRRCPADGNLATRQAKGVVASLRSGLPI